MKSADIRALALANCLCAVASAHPSGRQAVFRGGADLVQFDVSVLDSRRQPIRGLTAADFTLLEDGQPQKIIAFAAIDVASRPPLLANELTGVRTNGGK